MPRVGPAEAARRHWPLVLLPVVVLLGIAMFLGLARSPTYTAEVRMTVGQPDLTAPGALGNFPSAAASLASAYSRAADGDAVTRPVARRLGTTPEAVAARVSASPVPESPVFTVTATGASESQAVQLANGASQGLLRQVTSATRENPDSRRLLREFRVASRREAELRISERSLDRALDSSDSPRNRRELADVREELATTSLRARSTGESYREAQGSQVGLNSVVQVLAKAKYASSDRSSTLQIYMFAAVLAGLLIGFGLAMLTAQREMRRGFTTRST